MSELYVLHSLVVVKMERRGVRGERGKGTESEGTGGRVSVGWRPPSEEGTHGSGGYRGRVRIQGGYRVRAQGQQRVSSRERKGPTGGGGGRRPAHCSLRERSQVGCSRARSATCVRLQPCRCITYRVATCYRGKRVGR